MSLLAADFEENFTSQQMGGICPEVYYDWVANVVVSCPTDIQASMTDDIIKAFFDADINIFPEMFGSALAGIIYRKGHMLTLLFPHDQCFIEQPYMCFKKTNHIYGDAKFKYEIELYAGMEQFGRIQVPIDPWPEWELDTMYSINNPYYHGRSNE